MFQFMLHDIRLEPKIPYNITQGQILQSQTCFGSLNRLQAIRTTWSWTVGIIRTVQNLNIPLFHGPSGTKPSENRGTKPSQLYRLVQALIINKNPENIFHDLFFSFSKWEDRNKTYPRDHMVQQSSFPHQDG